ncbi:TonB-dependent siderophore receptor family protein 6 [Alloalcanivorax dieselolei B5]|uniref:TonB-dependent siderophore receptor family protein 6 n=1 Tax=Alcanivorax dieselolei (strain DSM 16502 / CGMCC 1.3690 / MCCC 1A00001 / B-5) TaxID=930169 RepID=K0CF39_ALCDB|nr:TonB-dependent siderophore receptor [Alloalcanivorax dieselolei]AFT70262.1 TonB-dependent siderophore receptor family protein 6 [Alloalcanivorax dieselolei B5]GGJ95225.1 ferric siderophore receptor [Alloalcanivorax dieselolei]
MTALNGPLPGQARKSVNNKSAAFALAMSCSLAGIGGAITLTPATAFAQQSTARQHFSIPPGKLSDVLAQFAAQAGVPLSFDPQVLSGMRSDGLEGTYSTQEGFQALLAGTGYGLQSKGESGYSLRRIPSDPVTLSPIRVDAGAGQESGYGPVTGYAATRSITATKMDIPLIETPQSVSVVTADQIEIQDAESLHQALLYTPGVVPMGSDNLVSDGLIIRGFNVTGSSPMYLNGSKLPRNTFSGVSEPYAMERIEMLKGPASVLYGNAAPGGIVNMVSKLPQSKTSRELKVQAGSFDRKQLAGDFTGALTKDGSLSYRVTGLVRRSDTMTDHIPDDRDFGQLSLRWQPSDDTSLTLLANSQHNDTVYLYGLPLEGTVRHNVNGDIDRDLFIGEPDFDSFETHNKTLGYLFSHRLNDTFTFRQNALYFDAETDWDYLIMGSLDASQRLLSRTSAARNDRDRTFTLDNQLQAKWHWGLAEHTSLIGLDYEQSRFKRTQYRGTAEALDIFNPVYGSPVALDTTPVSDTTQDSDKLGLYAQEHIKIDGHWVVMLGGRYDQVDGKGKDHLAGISATIYDEHAFTGRAGLLYLFDNGLAPYISYAESFEPISGQNAGGQAFEPTEGKQTEIGLRYQPRSGFTSITASAYQLTQENVLTSDLANPGFSVQEGEVESSGFELEARTNLSNGLNLIASYAYIDNEVTKSNSGTEGNRTNGVPRNMASLWADYAFDGSLYGLGLGAGVRYIGETRDIANTVAVPSYTVVDATLRYRLSPQWLMTLNVDNLFDEEYATCSYACFYGVKRSATVTVKYQW